MWKNIVERGRPQMTIWRMPQMTDNMAHATDDNMAHAHCMMDN
jgi:hypothetical protein